MKDKREASAEIHNRLQLWTHRSFLFIYFLRILNINLRKEMKNALKGKPERYPSTDIQEIFSDEP